MTIYSEVPMKAVQKIIHSEVPSQKIISLNDLCLRTTKYEQDYNTRSVHYLMYN